MKFCNNRRLQNSREVDDVGENQKSRSKGEEEIKNIKKEPRNNRYRKAKWLTAKQAVTPGLVAGKFCVLQV